MIKRTYFYSATQRTKSGAYAWWQGTLTVTSWLPLPAENLVKLAKEAAIEGLDGVRGPEDWHDASPRLVALNKL
ncbi:hypothetical protein [Vreelandella indica]|uniref:hypothetical protein n=1 Tax=Vreelandella indica TaxID=3126500 RepID=UPI00300E5E49